MHDKFIRQAYDELSYLRQCLAGAERYRLRTADNLRQRIALSEWRIRMLEWATFDNPRPR
jgi:hypothetical protein